MVFIRFLYISQSFTRVEHFSSRSSFSSRYCGWEQTFLISVTQGTVEVCANEINIMQSTAAELQHWCLPPSRRTAGSQVASHFKLTLLSFFSGSESRRENVRRAQCCFNLREVPHFTRILTLFTCLLKTTANYRCSTLQKKPLKTTSLHLTLSPLVLMWQEEQALPDSTFSFQPT